MRVSVALACDSIAPIGIESYPRVHEVSSSTTDSIAPIGIERYPHQGNDFPSTGDSIAPIGIERRAISKDGGEQPRFNRTYWY